MDQTRIHHFPQLPEAGVFNTQLQGRINEFLERMEIDGWECLDVRFSSDLTSAYVVLGRVRVKGN